MTSPSEDQQRARKSRRLHLAVLRLLKQNTPDDIYWALQNAITTLEKPGKPGQPRFFDAQTYMEVWLFVRMGMVRTGLSANAFCNRATLQWFTPTRNGPSVTKELSKATLRRRYQEAESFLQRETALLEYLQRGRPRPKAEPTPANITTTEDWWRLELRYRLAAEGLSENPA